MDSVGNTELRQRPASTSYGNWPRREPRAFSKHKSGNSVQRQPIATAKSYTMLTFEQSAAIFDRIQRYSSADEVELLISGNRFALTRFANNAIHQNVADENQLISVRTNFGGRTARATTNKLDEDSLRRVVESSETLAKVQQPDAELLPMPSANEASSNIQGSARART